MKKKWYKRKRYWILFLLPIGVWIVSQTEALQMRYNPVSFKKTIEATNNTSFVFKKKKIAGTTLQYGQLGSDAHLPVIVFVHGSPGSLAAYENYLKDSLLQQQAILIAVDRLGFGYSDFGKATSSLRLQAQLIATILEDFPNTKKILVGHSMGGPVNSRLAMDYPHLVDGMVLVAPSISPALEPSNRWRKVLDFPLFRWITPSALRVCNQEIIPLKEELVQLYWKW